MTNYDTLKEYETHKEPLPSYDEYKHLQKQLKEANAIIADMRPFIQASMSRQTFTRILIYEDKWGVK